MEANELVKKAEKIIYEQEQNWKNSGNYFNIFNTLKIERKEIRHSAFLADLLNPNGFHGLGNRFLKLFLKKINFETFPIDNAIVKIEETTEQNKRFDISITSTDKDEKKYKIVIENKIESEDNENQIKNYLSSLKQLDKNHYKLVYLTLQGDEPNNSIFTDEEKIENENIIICISYRIDIFELLREVSYVDSILPRPIMEIIREYILTIKELTNQGVDEKMSNEFKELLLTDDNMEVVEELHKQKEELRLNTLISFIELLYTNLSTRQNIHIVNNPKPNYKALANNYLNQVKANFILIRYQLSNFEDADFEFIIENKNGEVWTMIKKHSPNDSDTTYDILQKQYEEIAKQEQYKLPYINFKNTKNDEFKKFAKMNDHDKESYIADFVNKNDDIIAQLKK